MPKNCSTCEAYKEEKYQESDKKGNILLDELGYCKRFNYVFESYGFLPEKMVCDYHRRSSENEKIKETPKDYQKTKHNCNFREVQK